MQNNNSSRKSSSQGRHGSAKSSSMVAIKLLSKDGVTKPTSALVNKRSIQMTRCSNPSQGVHSCSYGSISDNLVISNNRGHDMSMTFPEAKALFAQMQQDPMMSMLFNHSSSL